MIHVHGSIVTGPGFPATIWQLFMESGDRELQTARLPGSEARSHASRRGGSSTRSRPRAGARHDACGSATVETTTNGPTPVALRPPGLGDSPPSRSARRRLLVAVCAASPGRRGRSSSRGTVATRRGAPGPGLPRLRARGARALPRRALAAACPAASAGGRGRARCRDPAGPARRSAPALDRCVDVLGLRTDRGRAPREPVRRAADRVPARPGVPVHRHRLAPHDDGLRARCSRSPPSRSRSRPARRA